MHVLYIYYNFTFIFHFSRNKFNVEARASIVATLLVLIVCIPRLIHRRYGTFLIGCSSGERIEIFLRVVVRAHIYKGDGSVTSEIEKNYKLLGHPEKWTHDDKR